MIRHHPHGAYLLDNGDEINFADGFRAKNGWWNIRDISMGRSSEGEDKTRRFQVNETERFLSKLDWPIPVRVDRKINGYAGRLGFQIRFESVWGTVTIGVNKHEKKLVVAVPPGMNWHIEKQVDKSTFSNGYQYKFMLDHTNEEEIEKYLANPFEWVSARFPDIAQFLPPIPNINWREQFSRPGGKQLTDAVRLEVESEDLMLLRGGYIELSKDALQHLYTLFDALKAVGIRVSIQHEVSYRRDSKIRGIRIQIPQDVAMDTGGVELHSEPHDISIGLDGVTIRCGYKMSEERMENYQKLIAAQELAGLVGMFSDDPDETEETSETITF